MTKIRSWLRRFREKSEKMSLSAFEDMFLIVDDDARNAFKKNPYAWMWLLVPIAGIAFFYGFVTEENINRRYKELEERRIHYEKYYGKSRNVGKDG